MGARDGIHSSLIPAPNFISSELSETHLKMHSVNWFSSFRFRVIGKTYFPSTPDKSSKSHSKTTRQVERALLQGVHGIASFSPLWIMREHHGTSRGSGEWCMAFGKISINLANFPANAYFHVSAPLHHERSFYFACHLSTFECFVQEPDRAWMKF